MADIIIFVSNSWLFKGKLAAEKVGARELWPHVNFKTIQFLQ